MSSPSIVPRKAAFPGAIQWACGRILVRDGANAGWIDYMLKGRQKSAFDGLFDCVIVESFCNPNVGA